MLAIALFIIVSVAIMIGSFPFFCLEGKQKHSVKHKDPALCSDDLLLNKKLLVQNNNCIYFGHERALRHGLEKG